MEKPASAMTPNLGYWRTRWRFFLRQKVSVVALVLFTLLVVISLFSEFIANDRPLVVYHQGETYFPVIIDYPETTFGGDFETFADYTDPYLVEIIESNGWMLWPLIEHSGTSINRNLVRANPSPPSEGHWLGTDDQGRDLLARILYATRISIMFSLLLTLGSSVVGVFLGALQGYYGGTFDLLAQRFIEIWSGLPVLFLLILLASLLQPGFWILLLLLLLFNWMSLVDLVRAEFLRGRNFYYVRAAQALGQRDSYIIFRHLLPNAMVSTFTFFPFIFTAGIVSLTSLDFLGYGLPPTSPSLGEIIAQAKANLHAPWLAVSAFGSMTLILTLVVLIGEGLRNAFDPRKTQVLD